MAQLPKSQRSSNSRGRRRRSRAFPILGFVFTAIGLAWFFESQATTTLILVRHADTDQTMAMAQGGDPPLNERGRARAELLANFLQDIDVIAGVDAIYASEALRTQQTAAPLAQRLELEVAIADHYDYEGFTEAVLRDHKGDIILVVTHSDAIAPLVEEVHGSKNVPQIAPDEYDNVYIVSIPWFGKVKTLRVRYGLRADFGAAYTELKDDSGL
jgi:broad specificity phosphatase PhoE